MFKRSVLFWTVLLVFSFLVPHLGRAEVVPPEFRQWVASIWPLAKAAGISRFTFDTAFGNIKPNLKIPDLALPHQKKDGSKGQAEFTKAPGDYLDESYLKSLAVKGRLLAEEYKSSLDKIEKEIGVDRYSLLAIWGRETAFGQHKLPYDALEVLATLAWTGRRKDVFLNELIHALKMLQSGVDRSDMHSSWAGALGLTQIMPSEYFQYAQDTDGDGKKDIFRSVPDALASAASQLRGKGWIPRQRWGYEVLIPDESDCSLEGPSQGRTISDWTHLGFKRSDGLEWGQNLKSIEAYLMSPAGSYGPSFLVFENFKVIRKYNTSDLYAVFVGRLADRIAGGGDLHKPFAKVGAQQSRTIEDIQIFLKKEGYGVEKIDGKIGSNTRMFVGLYQKKNGLNIDCWPSQKVLDLMLKRYPSITAETP